MIKTEDIDEKSIEDKVRFLSDPANYPNGSSFIRVVETHMSWVFILDKIVYKLKKPVKYSFLDFSTVALRKKNCETEVSLNKILADDVYIGAVPLSVNPVHQLQLEVSGRDVDWLVKMKRLPENCMLDKRIRENTLTQKEVIKTGEVLTKFYKRRKKENFNPEEYFSTMKSNILDNLSEFKKPEFKISENKIDLLINMLSKFLSLNVAYIKLRAEKIVEAHGDLRPEHICLQRTPVIIDRLEFNRKLRLLDPVEELSFLAMECDMLKAEWVGEKIIKVYEQATEDVLQENLIYFYKSIRAIQRSLASYRHILEPRSISEPIWIIKGNLYFIHATHYAELFKF
jgi:aminoglycoside phosphotransferase family enzyme